MSALKMKYVAAPDPPVKLNLPQVKILHRPVNTTQTIKDREKATDLLLGLRIYLQNRTTQ